MATSLTKFGGFQGFFNLTGLNNDIFILMPALRKSIIFPLHSSDLTPFNSVS